ncbi:ATP synthase mitochondrial F1 complex assembly factor 1-like [Tropilaelaps mercedesae]|uniref:ATP synthase mitochondrial F1 complex assembly factor 1-like n=1 Tax=Tropilaelaps mercedesae TaxID=418985 RepID=A0A1V9XC00_9ACAR|nr:ATP synthase mitochondrial F1 complex assembly factor 1-like [Tropilaelaps mercedesae]
MFVLRTFCGNVVGHFGLRCYLRLNTVAGARCYSIGVDNPYFSKYASKLKKLQDESPTEFECRIKQLKQKRHKKMIVKTDGTVPPVNDGPVNLEAVSRQTKQPMCIDQSEELRKLSLAELTDVWRERHATKNAICGVVPENMFETMSKRGVEFPLFIYPLPRGDGYEIYFGQVASGGLDVHFTPLAEYQRHQSEAPPILRLTFFMDFKDTHKVILMAGEYNGEVMGPEHAQCLANQHQIYYGSAELKRKLLLWNFNREPKSFNYEVLIEEFQKNLGSVRKDQIVN